MANKNEIIGASKEYISNSFNFDELEEKLQDQLDAEFLELEFLEKESKTIGNPDALGETIKGVIWEQFLNQIAVKAGEDFIQENRGLTLDLRNDAHIQTTENFAKGKIAKHNTHIDYQKRHNEYQANFQKNEDGSTKTTVDRRSGKEKQVLNSDARKPYDKNRPSGSGSQQMDHTISAGEIIRDPAANAHLTEKERVDFANSEENLNLIDSAANQSKGDSTTEEWMSSTRDGKTPDQRFDIDKEQMEQKDKEARAKYEQDKKEGEERSIAAGKKSQREEALKISGKALRAAAMLLLSELAKEIISKLVAWFKLAKRDIESLAQSVKKAITSFTAKLKSHLLNAGNGVIATIATAIFGPIISMIRKLWMILKQGWRSLKDAVAYIRNPENKGKDIGLMSLEIGKIVMAGLVGISALALGEAIEKVLISVPGFAFDIPLFGSLANVIGLFMGAAISGIIGALIINFLDKLIAKRRKNQLLEKKIDKNNEILTLQTQLLQGNIE